MNSLDKYELIKNLETLGCNLLRDDTDIDFALLDRRKKDDIYKFLTDNGFICTDNNNKKMNFKLFKDCKIVDVDVEINTSYLKQYFYDIDINQDFEKEYFNNPQKHQIAMKCLRYLMLLRARDKKYRNYLLEHKDFIEKNNFFLDKLTKNPIKKSLDFTEFIKVAKADKKALLKYVKTKYIFYFLYKKVYSLLFIRGKIVAIDGVDGAGKTTIIKMLTNELDKPSFYMGERGFRFDNLYKDTKKTLYLKIISFILKYFEKLYRYFVVFKATKKYSIVFTDRYHRYSSTAMSKKYLDFFNKIFFYFYPKPDIYIVLWNDADTILKRKQEVSREYIENFNKTKEKEYKDAIFIKNDNLDETLNNILKSIYA